MEMSLSQVSELAPKRAAVRPVSKEKGNFRPPIVWAVGGGKGGVGKSFVVSNLGIFLGKQGHRTLLVDADFGGSNLHTFLGISAPTRGLHDFFAKRSRNIGELIVPTEISGVSLLGGAQHYLEAANPKFAQKERLQQILTRADTDYVLLDLGAGTAFYILDLFLFAQEKIVVVSPEPTSVENVYQFLKSAFFRWVKREISSPQIKQWVDRAIDQRADNGIKTPLDLIQRISEMDPQLTEEVENLRRSFRVKLVVNQVRTSKDNRLLDAIVQACDKHLGLTVEPLGCVPFDDTVWKSIRSRKPFVQHYSHSASARRLEMLLKKLVLPEKGKHGVA